MAQRFTVHLTPETLALIREDESISGRLNDICQRYAALRANLPDAISDIDANGDMWLQKWQALEACRKAIED